MLFIQIIEIILLGWIVLWRMFWKDYMSFSSHRWNFIPAHSRHHDGIWEAAAKQVKLQVLKNIRPTQHFWTRWSKEYLSLLKQRRKWNNASNMLMPGTIVLLADDNLPPLYWGWVELKKFILVKMDIFTRIKSSDN